LIEDAERTRTGVVKGKLAYLAPEQIANVRASPVTDVFAAGIVLHELLANERLFVSDNDFNTLYRLKTLRVPAPSSRNAQVPSELDRIALRALERDPSRRYRAAAEMAEELERYCGKVGFTQASMKALVVELRARALPAAPASPQGVSLFDGDCSTARPP